MATKKDGYQNGPNKKHTDPDMKIVSAVVCSGSMFHDHDEFDGVEETSERVHRNATPVDMDGWDEKENY